MKGSLYKITNKVNNKMYIGITFQNPPIKRWNGHKSKARNGGRLPLYESIRKYGEDNFEFEVIYTDIEEEQLYINNCLKWALKASSPKVLSIFSPKYHSLVLAARNSAQSF